MVYLPVGLDLAMLVSFVVVGIGGAMGLGDADVDSDIAPVSFAVVGVLGARGLDAAGLDFDILTRVLRTVLRTVVCLSSNMLMFLAAKSDVCGLILKLRMMFVGMF